MSASSQTAIVHEQVQAVEWSPAVRIAFRFSLLYLGMFSLFTQIVTSFVSGTQGQDIPDPGTLWPIRPIVSWTSTHLFHVNAPLSFGGNTPSGDSVFGWVMAFCLLVISVIGAFIWSALDHRRNNYDTLHQWFRLFIRFALAGQLINYGLAKVVPLQMPYPSLTRLLEPFGNFSPMGVLWSSIGAAPAYEIFAGCAEVFGGLLLVLPRTTTLGALLCLADMIQVFMLNMTYDVPVKLFAFHLILLSCFLLAPDLQRILNVLLFNRPVAPAVPFQFFRGMRANRLMLIAQIVLGLWLIVLNLNVDRKYWKLFGPGSAKSELYGIWEVSQMSIDNQLHPPLLTDNDRWRRVVFEFPTQMTLQRMDDSFVNYAATINSNDKTLALARRDWKANLTLQRPVQNQLLLDGAMAGHQVHIELRLVDRNKFLLVNRGFHWIQDLPSNR